MRIPVDATAPIACTASNDEIPIHLEWVEQMRSEQRRVERTEGGLLLRFAPSPETEALLHEFALAEKGCCQFWGFAIEALPGELIFRWGGPPNVSEYLDRLHDWFHTDEPLTAVSGLL